MYVCTCGLIGSAEVDMISDYFSLSGHIKKKQERKKRAEERFQRLYFPSGQRLFIHTVDVRSMVE